MAVKMRWGPEVNLQSVPPGQEFTFWKPVATVVGPDKMDRFKKVLGVMRVTHYRYKRGLPIEPGYVAIARNDGIVQRAVEDCMVYLVEHYNEKESDSGPSKPKKKRK